MSVPGDHATTRATRTQFLVAGAAAAAAAATAGALGAQTLPKVRAVGIPIDVSGAVYYATDLGIFKKYGLDVEVDSMGSGASVAPAVAGGAADVGSANFISLAQGHERGVPFLMIAPSGEYTSKSPTTQLLVAKDSPIKTAKDLSGKVVGVVALNNIAQITVSAWVDKNGGDYKAVKFTEVPFAQMAAALAGGRVDAVEIAEPFLSGALNSGDARSLAADGDAIGSTWVEGGYFCTVTYAKNNPDILKNFAGAIAEAGRWANAHPDAATAIMLKYSKGQPQRLRYHIVFPERFKPSDAQPLIDAAAKYGALKAAFPSVDMMAPEALVQ
ncbi:MAG: ABC transporter substrate-binding protein [Candidatus Lustribacter sp.]|jgi:NitT/TauT family transport system substrate-binding protein